MKKYSKDKNKSYSIQEKEFEDILIKYLED